MSKSIEVTIDEGGKIDAVVKGVRGKSCQQDLDWLDKVGEVISENPTEDFEKQPELLRQENATQRR